jgi:23S rRNA (guanosine2251-2'-O)-methyltransferase
LLVILDGVTDPRNLGAIIRSAAGFGAHGVIIPERRAARMTAAAWKTSAGAAVRVPVAQVTNLTRQIKESGARITRLEGELSIERDGRKSDAEIYKREITRLKGRALVYGAAGFAAGAIAAGIVALATP